ncbi:carbohydrate porin [Inquilinus sp. CA228]|uniref:carbohydrate porin n=1 Tax=Inquilinus sp. CA228 TaxID=3455609 RepID=UPI003F8D802A
MMVRMAAGVLLAAALAGIGTARAEDAGNGKLTGDWGGVRTDLQKAGVDFQLGYTSELAYNPAGGTKDQLSYADQLSFGATFDLDRLLGVHDAKIQLTITDRNGRNLSDDAQLGTLQQVQEIFGRGQTWRLTQFWYDQKYFSGLLDWKIGRLTVGEDFASFTCSFQNLTFCGSQPGNIVGNYWYNWPVSQWATRLKANIKDVGYVQVGVYQMNPGFLNVDQAVLPNTPAGTTGAMIPVEFGWTPALGPARLPGSYKFGAWYDTSTAADVLDDDDGNPEILTGRPFEDRRGRYGAYINFLQQLTHPDANDPSRGLSIFLNATIADRRTATIDDQIALGLLYKGPFDARPKDEIGLAVGRTHVNGRVAKGQRLLNDAGLGPVAVQDAEYAFELYYGLQATDWLLARPNLQFIHHPGGTSHNDDVVVIGLKTSIDF